MIIATASDAPVTGIVPKFRHLPRWRWVLIVLGLGLVVGIAFTTSSVVRRRSTVPEAIVVLEWPDDPKSEPKIPVNDIAIGRRNGLGPAPDPRLIEALPMGLLPRIGDDGSRPSEIYARPATPAVGNIGSEPRIAILISGAGIGHLATVEAMVKLPADIALALSPYATDIDRQAADIRSEGHEIYLDLPISQSSELYGGAGPRELGDSFDLETNQSRLRWALGRFPGYVGLSGHFRDRLKDGGSAASALAELATRGLLQFDLSNDPINLDADLRTQAIDDALHRLEQTAREKGQAIGVAGTTPLAIDRLKNWSATLASRGFRLVPVSTLLHPTGAP